MEAENLTTETTPAIRTKVILEEKAAGRNPTIGKKDLTRQKLFTAKLIAKGVLLTGTLLPEDLKEDLTQVIQMAGLTQLQKDLKEDLTPVLIQRAGLSTKTSLPEDRKENLMQVLTLKDAPDILARNPFMANPEADTEGINPDK